jgi:hypothetical protein
MQVFSAPIDHLEILMTRMAELSTAHRSAAAAQYIEQREKLGKPEQYAAISTLKLISNLEIAA